MAGIRIHYGLAQLPTPVRFDPQDGTFKPFHSKRVSTGLFLAEGADHVELIGIPGKKGFQTGRIFKFFPKSRDRFLEVRAIAYIMQGFQWPRGVIPVIDIIEIARCCLVQIMEKT